MAKELEQVVMHVFPGLRPGGGPSGYGFNLQKALHFYGMDNKELVPIGILAPKGKNSSKPETTSGRFNFVRKLPPWLAAFLLFIRYKQVSKNFFKYSGFSSSALNQMRLARVLVFHDFKLAKAYLTQIGKQPNQKVLVMSHSPTNLSAEIIENWRASIGPSSIWEKIYKVLAEEEFKTLISCDGLITPCVHSISHYFNEDPKKREQVLSLPIYEILSGVDEKRATKDRQEVLSSLGISLGSKVIGFFGRHHPHKGYDIFCQAAQLAYEANDKELFFLSAGSGPIPSPRNIPNFKDLGYITSGLENIIAAVDLVVVPNRVNYFDLLILEAMSLGKIILTTPVGGALCIKSSGIFFLKDLSPYSLYHESKRLLADPLIAKMGAENREMYLKEYTLQRFAERHIQLANALLCNVDSL